MKLIVNEILCDDVDNETWRIMEITPKCIAVKATQPPVQTHYLSRDMFARRFWLETPDDVRITTILKKQASRSDTTHVH